MLIPEDHAAVTAVPTSIGPVTLDRPRRTGHARSVIVRQCRDDEPHPRPRRPRRHRGRRHRRGRSARPTSPSTATASPRSATVTGRAARRSTPRGLLVTPGWVDIHTHYDGQVTWDPLLAPSSWHGVTTVVMGNCGVGFAPVRADQHDWLIELMEGVEDIPGTALHEGITWDWETLPRVPRRDRAHRVRARHRRAGAARRAARLRHGRARRRPHRDADRRRDRADGRARGRGHPGRRARASPPRARSTTGPRRRVHADAHRDRRRAARHRPGDRRDRARACSRWSPTSMTSTPSSR